MCGLVGVWHPDPAAAGSQLLAWTDAMARAIRHRGPDDAGLWHDPSAGLALGHRRLAILDRSAAGHQPMASASGRFQLVFNGEIYNHRAIRRDLETAGLLQRPWICLLYTSPSPRDRQKSRMPSSA